MLIRSRYLPYNYKNRNKVPPKSASKTLLNLLEFLNRCYLITSYLKAENAYRAVVVYLLNKEKEILRVLNQIQLQPVEAAMKHR